MNERCVRGALGCVWECAVTPDSPALLQEGRKNALNLIFTNTPVNEWCQEDLFNKKHPLLSSLLLTPAFSFSFSVRIQKQIWGECQNTQRGVDPHKHATIFLFLTLTTLEPHGSSDLYLTIHNIHDLFIIEKDCQSTSAAQSLHASYPLSSCNVIAAAAA